MVASGVRTGYNTHTITVLARCSNTWLLARAAGAVFGIFVACCVLPSAPPPKLRVSFWVQDANIGVKMPLLGQNYHFWGQNYHFGVKNAPFWLDPPPPTPTITFLGGVPRTPPPEPTPSRGGAPAPPPQQLPSGGGGGVCLVWHPPLRAMSE